MSQKSHSEFFNHIFSGLQILKKDFIANNHKSNLDEAELKWNIKSQGNTYTHIWK